MRFGEAQVHLADGARVARSGWNSRSAWVAQASNPEIVGVGPIEDFYYITQGTRRNTWVPSSADLLADDWQIVPYEVWCIAPQPPRVMELTINPRPTSG